MKLNFFHFTQFLLNAHRATTQQLISLEKLKTENLKFRTDLWDWVMVGWSWHRRWSSTKADQKISKSKIEACPVNAGHHMAFKHHIYLWQIWLQILVAINSEPCQTSFPSFFAPPWSHCAVLFKSEQRPFSQTGHLRRFRSSALLRIRFRTRPTNDWAKQWALLGQR